ncbi:MAG: 5'/3'-nucleotidase SurE [Chthoniobacterales bacterium]|nr:5'/3'-nucleotidase SurE [Chthoniobacterales bacterium]
MNILASNDDGVYALGLKILVEELRSCGEVTVVAPSKDCSGASNSLTLNDPLRMHTLENGFISVSGTPTDCVHLAITGLLNKEFSMVVSGINAGSNLGDDILYSGTVAAAMEGRFLGLPSIAISLAGKHGSLFAEKKAHHYKPAAVFAKNLIKQLQLHPLPPQTILNINVPDLPLEQIKGIEITRLGARHQAEAVIKERDPRGRPIYWVGEAGPEEDAGIGTDFFAINSGKISITPIKLDLTDYKAFSELSKCVSGLNIS